LEVNGPRLAKGNPTRKWMMTMDIDKTDVSGKPSHELQALIDGQVPGSPFRIKAQEELFRRQKERDERNEKVQDSIRSMTRIILWLTLLAVGLGIFALLKK
jgi:hypothetical protein